MDYQITPIAIDGYADADGVYENRDGTWLGEIDDGEVQPYADEAGNFVPVPTNWRDLVIEEL